MNRTPLPHHRAALPEFLRRLSILSCARTAEQGVTLLALTGLSALVWLHLLGQPSRGLLTSSVPTPALTPAVQQHALNFLMLMTVVIGVIRETVRNKRRGHHLINAHAFVQRTIPLALFGAQVCTLMMLRPPPLQALTLQLLLIVAASAIQTSHEAERPKGAAQPERPGTDQLEEDHLDWGQHP